MKRNFVGKHCLMAGAVLMAAALWIAPASWGKGPIETPAPSPAPVAREAKSPAPAKPSPEQLELKKKQEQADALARQQRLEEEQRQKRMKLLSQITGDEALADLLSRSPLKEDEIKKVLDKYDFGKNLKAEEMKATRTEAKFTEDLQTGFMMSSVAKEGDYQLLNLSKSPDGVTGFLESKAPKRADKIVLTVSAVQKDGSTVKLKCEPIENVEPGERRMVRLPKLDQEIDLATVKIAECRVSVKPKF
ncbi:MAG: hypothetical protein NTX50_10150 [Candidatus Sumerlaeota bacterium]|nr:hypothetical protein [Candidatus Sumerlaeota bacterium]